jgi:hypothetical protein
VKYVKLKSDSLDKSAHIPKPPLAKQKPHHKPGVGMDELSSEALLKMADEGLARLDQ